MLGAYWLLKNSLKYSGTRWVMGRASLKTLKETTLNSFFNVCAIQGVRPKTHFTYNASSNIITFNNKSEIFLKDLAYYPSDPNYSELGSLEITGAFVDECDQVTERLWEILFTRTRHKVAHYGLIQKILGSCNPNKEWPFRRFYKPWENGHETEDIRFIQALVTDNPDIDANYIKGLKRIKDKATRERLLLGNWNYDDNPNMLCTYDGLHAMFGGNILSKPNNFYITCDAARFGSDQSIIVVWNGFVVVDFITFDKNSVTECANAINYYRIKYSVPNTRCIADDDGVGGGVVDICKINGFVNNSKAFDISKDNQFDNTGLYNTLAEQERYYNLQAQCGYKFAEYVNQHLIGFDSELDVSSNLKDRIFVDLEQLQSWQLDKEHRGLRLKPKEEIKASIGRSPDWRDVLLMRMWFLYVEEGNKDIYRYL